LKDKSKAGGYRDCRTAGDCNGTYESSMEQTISSTSRFTKLHRAQGDDAMRICAYPHPAPVTLEEAAFDSVLLRSGAQDRSEKLANASLLRSDTLARRWPI